MDTHRVSTNAGRLSAAGVGLVALLLLIGVLLWTARPAGAVPGTGAAACTWDDLTAAFAVDDAVIHLAADIAQGGPNLSVPDGHSVTFDLAGHSLDLAAPDFAAAIDVPGGSSLTIEDTIGGGALTAAGGLLGAGIGGGDSQAAGAVRISGGTITTSSVGGAAGIGGGFGSSGGEVDITGGSVTATGGGFAAGIGGGNGGPGGSLTVSAGSVTATAGGGGSGGGAGVGGGFRAAGGPVTVSGGSVTATGTDGGAGIGGGLGGGGGSLTVSGGSVTATGGANAPGVGAGGAATSGAAVTIDSGGTLTAAGGGGASAIGNAVSGAGFGSLLNAGRLTIPDAATLTIPAGVTAVNRGTLSLGGTLNGAGTLTNAGTVLVHGAGVVAGDGQGAGGLAVTEHNYTLTFDSAGTPATVRAAAPAADPVLHVYAPTVHDSDQTLPALAVRTGFHAGWYTARTGGSQVTASTDLSTDSIGGAGPVTVALFARDVIDTETVRFATPNGTPAPAPQLVNYGSTATKPATDPAKPGFAFVGWFRARTGGPSYRFTTPVTTDLTLYAHYLAVAPTTSAPTTSGPTTSGPTTAGPTTSPTAAGLAATGPAVTAAPLITIGLLAVAAGALTLLLARRRRH